MTTATLNHAETENMETAAVAARIRKALRARSGKAWSVTRGRGTTACWINIGGDMDNDRRAELGRLLGLDSPCHSQGCDVPASHDYYREFIDRAEGRQPRKIAKPYWD